jgi:hypothetical protein
MQPYTRSVFDLFDGKKRYVMPLFQRQYVWTREEQWEPLWDDIERKLSERLRSKEGPPHFLGAMVIDQKRVFGNAVPTHLVIDGQQRLTTFQVFLSAFRDICSELGHPSYADECDRYLINTGIMGDAATEKYKVWPTNVDRKQFMDVLDSRSRAELEKRHPLVRRKYARKPEPRAPMVECYLFFYQQLKNFLASEEFDLDRDDRIARIHDALRTCLQIVTIELEGNDDPQVIFETLNARGQPLLPSDLLRNFVFLRASQGKEPADDLYTTYWLPFDEPFWKEEERQGRLRRPRSDIFLQHYLTMQRKDDLNIGHLYAEYRYWIAAAKPFPTVKDELQTMHKYRQFFRQLIEPDDGTSLGRLALTLIAFDTRTTYPLLLGLLGRELPEEERTGIFADLASYIVRRAVCGLTTKNYNRVFLSMLAQLPDGGLGRASFRRILLGLQGDSTVWPNDERFRQAWLENPAYDQLMPARAKFVLRAIEERLHDAKAEHIVIKSELTVEHVLPQDWIDEWPLANGQRGATWHEQWDKTRGTEDIQLSLTRDRLKHSLGCHQDRCENML